MSTKLLAMGALILGCVGAAAGGAYFALRNNATDVAVSQVAAEPTQASAPVVEAPAATAPSEPVTPSAQPASITEPALQPTRARVPPATSRPAEISARSTADASSRPSQDASSAAIPPSTETSAPAAAVKTDPVPPSSTTNGRAEGETPVTTAAAVPDLPKAQYRDVTVPADSVIGIRLDSTLSTETAKVEDAVNARVSRDVLVDGRTAIAAGARLEGFVTAVERGGKFKDRPRLGIRFTSLVLADGTRTAIQTETIYREGESPTSQSVAKVGGSAVVGAILGGLLGGKKGAVAGSAVGAAGGAAAVAKGDRPETVLTSGLMLTVRLTSPVTVTIERDHD